MNFLRRLLRGGHKVSGQQRLPDTVAPPQQCPQPSPPAGHTPVSAAGVARSTSPTDTPALEYQQACLEAGLTDGDDDRDFTQFPELAELERRLEAGALIEAARLAEDGMKKHPDVDLFWGRAARIELKRGDTAKAIALYTEGMARCLRKSVLCTSLGDLFYEQRQQAVDERNKAAMWWCRGAVAQLEGGVLRINTPFLALATIAAGYGKIGRDMTGQSNQLLQWADLAEPGRLRYNLQTTANIMAFAATDGPHGPICMAIERLCAKYSGCRIVGWWQREGR